MVFQPLINRLHRFSGCSVFQITECAVHAISGKTAIGDALPDTRRNFVTWYRREAPCKVQELHGLTHDFSLRIRVSPLVNIITGGIRPKRQRPIQPGARFAVNNIGNFGCSTNQCRERSFRPHQTNNFLGKDLATLPHKYAIIGIGVLWYRAAILFVIERLTIITVTNT